MYQILLCDDEEDILYALKIYLRNSDYRFFEAHTGKEALEVMRNEEIDLVLMDIMMRPAVRIQPSISAVLVI